MNYVYLYYYKLLNNNTYINLIFFILWNVYCFYTTSAFMEISRPEGFWDDYDLNVLPMYTKEKSYFNYPDIPELPGDIPAPQSASQLEWNGLFMDPNHSNLQNYEVNCHDNYGVHHNVPQWHRDYTYQDRGGERLHNHYHSSDRNPYVINPVDSKTGGILKSLKNKVVEFGHKLDRGTEKYIQNRERLYQINQEKHRLKSKYKEYEKLYGKSAMDKWVRAEAIMEYPHKLKNIKFKKKKVILY